MSAHYCCSHLPYLPRFPFSHRTLDIESSKSGGPAGLSTKSGFIVQLCNWLEHRQEKEDKDEAQHEGWGRGRLRRDDAGDLEVEEDWLF